MLARRKGGAGLAVAKAVPGGHCTSVAQGINEAAGQGVIPTGAGRAGRALVLFSGGPGAGMAPRPIPPMSVVLWPQTAASASLEVMLGETGPWPRALSRLSLTAKALQVPSTSWGEQQVGLEVDLRVNFQACSEHSGSLATAWLGVDEGGQNWADGAQGVELQKGGRGWKGWTGGSREGAFWT